MEENATQKIEKEIEDMVTNLREIVQEAQATRTTRKNWKMWKPIRNVNDLFTNTVFGKWSFRHRSVAPKEMDSIVTP
ncbi:MAG: hypothetical protein A2156_08550 [Deltaproteobacteria bacterium RBG_16_48_10]|nr:MAG: hypothetical protein A2156_08550 [Deltaproteobacteria bacterium RBG_16_48_10]